MLKTYIEAISAREAAVARLPIHEKRNPQTRDGKPPFRAAVALDVKTASQVAIMVVPKPSNETKPKLRCDSSVPVKEGCEERTYLKSLRLALLDHVQFITRVLAIPATGIVADLAAVERDGLLLESLVFHG